MDPRSVWRDYLPLLRRYWPIVVTVAVVASLFMAAQIAAGPRTYTGAELGVAGSAASTTPDAKPTATSTASEAATPAPTEAPPETAAPTEEPPPPPTPAPTRRPTAPPPPPPPPPPNPGGLGIGGRVTTASGAGYGGVCVTIGPPIRCATTTAANGTYYISLESAPLGLAWDVRFLVGGVVRVERLGVVVSGPTTINATIP
jgi:hypothetical protein